jgi:sugar lactone lactonase YvrE
MIRVLVSAAVLAHGVAFTSAAQAQSPASTCDVACMTDVANRFMDAMTRSDPKELPWADRVGYAENSTKLRIGEGSWVTIKGRSKAPLVVADPHTGHVVWAGAIDDHGQAGFYAMDMKLRRGRIASVQSVIRRREGRAPFGDPATYAPDGKFTTDVPVKARLPRGQMIALVDGYFAAQAANGANPGVGFDKGCVLIENGVRMSGNLLAAAGDDASCGAPLKRGLWGEIEAVRHQVLAVDEARGLVAAIGYRDLPGAKASFTTQDGATRPAEARYPRTVGFVSVFKIEGGKIARLETIANEVPYLTPAPFNPPRAKDVVVDDTQVFMESVTADASGNLYAGSFKGNIYRALPGSGTAIAWIRPDATNKLASVLGVLADDRSGTLWACSVPMGKPGQVSALAAFDLKSGAFKARYELPAPASVCNDIALDKDGTAFIAETSNGRIFVLQPGGKDLSLLVEDKALLAGVDGIAFSADGTLYVNNVRQNTMLRVNRKDDGSFAGLTTLKVSMPLNGPDGLRSIGGKRFLQAEGPAGRISRLTIEGDVVTMKVLRDGMDGVPGVTNIGYTAYAVESKGRFLFDPTLKGKDPGVFALRAVPMGGIQ